MGRDFNWEICVDTCTCHQEKTCECNDQCDVETIIWDARYPSEHYEECDCEKVKTDRFYLRNNPKIWEIFQVADTPKHFLYRDIKLIVNGM